jgi:uncharacterized protein YkwD
MKRYLSHLIWSSLIIPLVVLVACAQEPQPTATSTVRPTATAEAVEPQVEIKEVVQTLVIPSEVVVENFIVQKRDDTADEVEIVVQGYLRNTCTTIDDLSITQEGDLLTVGIQTKVADAENCEEAQIQFQEVVTQGIGDLEPGTYLITSGPIEKLDIQAAAEGAGDGTAAAEDGAATGEEAPSGEDASTGDEGATAAAEPRECQDYAVFLGDITYPDNTVVTIGETFTKTWEIQNAGDCTWGPGYTLTAVSGIFEEVTPVEDPFPSIIPSGTVTVSLVLTAPFVSGETSGAWVIQRPEGDNVQIRNGENFDLWAIVNVVEGGGAFTVEEARVYKDGVVCAQANTAYDSQTLALINAVREENGLPAYEVNEQLTTAARALTSDMACNDFVNHTGSDGSSWKDRIAAEGYLFEDTGENIYFGFAGIPDIAFSWWMDSSVHSGNILSATYTEIGIAYALNPQTGGSYYTLVFALPQAEE